MTLRPISVAGLARQSDPLGASIKSDLLTRRVVGRRLEHGPSPAFDEVLDKLIVLRAWTARRLVN